MSWTPSSIAKAILSLPVLWNMVAVAHPQLNTAEVIHLSSRRQLFVDSYLIEKMEGLRQTLHQPRKYPSNPVLHADQPWELGIYLHGAPAVVYDAPKKTFQMWYITYTAVDPKTGQFKESFSPTYATSKDGIHWEKPMLGQVAYAGSKQNNLLDWKSQLPNGMPHAYYDPHDADPTRRYKAAFSSYILNNRGRQSGIYVSFSSDGIHWRDYAGNPVLDNDGDFHNPRSKAHDTHTVLGWDERVQKYVGYFRPPFFLAGGVRVIGRSESPDFIHWTDPAQQIILRPDARDSRGTEFYGMPGMVYEDVYIGLLWIYHNEPYWSWPRDVTITDDQLARNEQTMDTQLATSRDGVKWARAGDRQTFLSTGELGTWDDACIYPTTPLVIGDEVWIYYGGMNMRHTRESLSNVGKVVGGVRKTAGIGLAKLRLDEFVSIDAGAKQGSLLTKAFSFSGDTLWLNCDAIKGSVSVEVLDDQYNPIPGYTEAEAIPQRGQALSMPVRWRSGSSLKALVGKRIRLRFVMQNASLYSFRVSSG